MFLLRALRAPEPTRGVLHSWAISADGLSADEHVNIDLRAGAAIEAGMAGAPAPCPGGIDFAHPDLAMMCARSELGAGTTAWFYVSPDRCRREFLRTQGFTDADTPALVS